MDNPIRVFIMEDDPDFCFLIRSTLLRQPDMQIVGAAAGREEAVLSATRLNPDIVLADLNLSYSKMDGIDAAREIRLATQAKIIILTAFENPQIVTEASKRAFASGYVFKSQFDFLVETIRKTAVGSTPQEHLIRQLLLSELSPAELSVMDMLLGGDIKLQSSQKTISNQKTSLLKKLGLKSQKELVHLFK